VRRECAPVFLAPGLDVRVMALSLNGSEVHAGYGVLMWVILFDLDFTLADTEECQPYLATQVGRDAVVSHLRANTIQAKVYSQELVTAFNQLRNHDSIRAAVISDSPRKYCLEVLRQCGYLVDDQLVFGAQGKPLVDFIPVKKSIAEALGVRPRDLNFIVVGDSPKDIYFAHVIGSISIFAKWGTRHGPKAIEKCHPSYCATDINVVKSIVNEVRSCNIEYEDYDFNDDYLTFDYDDVEHYKIHVSDIGYGKEYVPHSDNYRNAQDKYTSQNLHWIVKKAKNFPPRYHKDKKGMSLYGRDGVFQTKSLMRQAGFYKLDFMSWCVQKEITGKVVLIPVPSSVPHECNLSSPVKMICDWWALWINPKTDNIKIQVEDVFERFWPRPPSHLSEGGRTVEEQFETLGLYSDYSNVTWDADYVIIVDDVVTSGSHMNAIASFIYAAELIGDDTSICGYALYKTVHPENGF
jgi:hypothetical protein